MPQAEPTHYAVYGFAIKTGDQIQVSHSEDRWATIVDMLPYKGPYDFVKGIADFAGVAPQQSITASTSARRWVRGE